MGAVALSLQDCRGEAWAFHELMKVAKKEVPPARVLFARPHPKVQIGWFRRRLLRGEFSVRKTETSA